MAGPSIQITVTTPGAARARAFFAGLRADQIPFAAASALTKTAQQARDGVRDRMGRTFKVRSKGLPRTVQIEAASKRDYPSSRALVGVKDDFLARHITGGVKRPERGARNIAIPTRVVRRTRGGKVATPHKPRTLARRKRQPGAKRGRAAEVEFTSRSAGGKFAGTIRVSKSGRRGVAGVKGASIFWLLRRQAKIRKSWPFVAQVRETVRAEYAANFRRSMEHAFRTARHRG